MTVEARLEAERNFGCWERARVSVEGRERGRKREGERPKMGGERHVTLAASDP
jgi:hypothetical protein